MKEESSNSTEPVDSKPAADSAQGTADTTHREWRDNRREDELRRYRVRFEVEVWGGDEAKALESAAAVLQYIDPATGNSNLSVDHRVWRFNIETSSGDARSPAASQDVHEGKG